MRIHKILTTNREAPAQALATSKKSRSSTRDCACNRDQARDSDRAEALITAPPRSASAIQNGSTSISCPLSSRTWFSRNSRVVRHPARSSARRSSCRSVERCRRLRGASVRLEKKGRAMSPLCGRMPVGNKARNHVSFVWLTAQFLCVTLCTACVELWTIRPVRRLRPFRFERTAQIRAQIRARGGIPGRQQRQWRRTDR